jgi:hypothetical protein
MQNNNVQQIPQEMTTQSYGTTSIPAPDARPSLQYNVHMPKPPLPSQAFKEQQGTGQRLRPYEYKERNKGMYNSSMNSSSNNSTMKQLSSFARQVKESGDAVGPEKKPAMNMLNPNQTAPGGQFPGPGSRDLKLVTSAIFMNSKGNES